MCLRSEGRREEKELKVTKKATGEKRERKKSDYQAWHIVSNFHFPIYDISSRLVRLETILSRYDILGRGSYSIVCFVT